MLDMWQEGSRRTEQPVKPEGRSFSGEDGVRRQYCLGDKCHMLYLCPSLSVNRKTRMYAGTGNSVCLVGH